MLPALVATDVDGTLLDSREMITRRTRDAVSAAVAAGVTFVLATGRPPRWIPPVVEQLGFAPLAVCANGAVIYDAASDRIISARTLPVDVLTVLPPAKGSAQAPAPMGRALVEVTGAANAVPARNGTATSAQARLAECARRLAEVEQGSMEGLLDGVMGLSPMVNKPRVFVPP